jgi:hypothetical protein
MPKALCLSSLVASILIVVLFLEDAITSMLGMNGLAIFGGASLMMDIVFAIVAGLLIYLSWTTYQEQR